MSEPAPAAARSALAPLRLTVFRWLWIAAVVSNIGSWMQTVGAQWFLVDNQSSPTVIALVQTAAAAPVLLFGLGAGVISELFNRRRLLIGVQAFQVCVGVGLAALTAAGEMTPALLLVATFLIGSANALQLPAYMALVPEIVPRPLIPDAATLSSIGVNIARAVGPAIAGIAIARLGVPFVFAVNAATFAVFLVVLVAWRGYRPPLQRAEPFLDAARAGLRYVRYAGVIRRLYVHLALFMIPANALWALLPLIAKTQLGVGSNGYGLLLFAVGTGAIVGAFVTSAARRRLGTSVIVTVSSVVYGAGTALVALSHSMVVTLVVLVVVGVAWIGVIATINGVVQSFLPSWVRARGLSVYQVTLFGCTALGSAVAGALGTAIGVPVTMTLAGVLAILSGGVLLVRPLLSTADRDRAVVALPLTDLPTFTVSGPDDVEDRATMDDGDFVGQMTPVPGAGHTLVLVRYVVPESRRVEFIAQMRLVERSRRRTGAREWQLYTDLEHPAELVEAFTLGSWREHLSQHESRHTGDDIALLALARDLAVGDPVVQHLVAVDRA